MRKLAVACALVSGVFGSAVSDAAALQCDYDVIVLVQGKSRGYAALPNAYPECSYIAPSLSTILNSSKAYLTAENMSFVCASINMYKPLYSVVTSGHCVAPVPTKPVDATTADTAARPVEPAPMGR